VHDTDLNDLARDVERRRRLRGEAVNMCDAVSVGGVDRARYLEAAEALLITLLSHGEPPGSALNWTRPTEPVMSS